MKIFRKKEGKSKALVGGKARVGLIATLSTAIAACVACAFVAIFGGSFVNNNDDWGITTPPVAEAATYTTWKAASDASAFTSGGNVVINLAANLTAVADTTYGTTFGNAGTTYTSATNNKGYFYGALLVPTGCTVTLNLGTYTVDRALTAAKTNGYVIAVYGNLTVTGSTGKIYRGYSSGSGGGVYIANGGNLTWNGGLIDNCKAANGGGIYGDVNSALRINSNSGTHIQNCVASTDGGGIYFNGSNIYVYTCNIHNNTARDGAGVYVGANYQNAYFDSDATFVYSNTASRNGGAVYAGANRTYDLQLRRGRYYSNKAVNGGAVYVEGRVNFAYTPRIFKNTATTNGGGVFVATNGYCLLSRRHTSFTFIYANTATNAGGGVYNNGDLRTRGCNIGWGYSDDFKSQTARGNTAKYGGGVYNDTNGYFRMEGGRIEYNTATSAGGGVYNNGTPATGTAHPSTSETAHGYCTIQSYHAPQYVRNNKVGSANNNLYLPNGKYIRIASSLYASGTLIGISTQTKPTGANNATGSVKVIEVDYSTGNGDAKNFFFSDLGTGYGMYTAGAGKMMYHCTGGVNANTAATGVQYDSWAAASAAGAFKSGAIVRVNLLNDFNATTGDTNYTTTFGTKNTVYNSVTDTKGIYHGALLVPAGCTVYLNLGQSDIRRQLSTARAEGYVMLVYGHLYLYGNGGLDYGNITGGRNTGDGGAIRVENGGVVDAVNVTITGNRAANGGAIHVAAGGRYNSSGGYIKQCTATTNGGAVNNLGTFYFYSGYIGMVNAGFGCTAKNGGAIYNAGTLTVQGGYIINNTATTAGAGIYQNGTMNINTATTTLWIKNNLVGSANQNLYLPNGKLFVVNASITRGGSCVVGVYTQTAPTGASASGTKICNAYTSSYGALNLLFKSDQGKGIYQSSPGQIGYHSASGGSNKADNTTFSYTSWEAASAALAFKAGNTVNITLAADLTAVNATGALAGRNVKKTFCKADTATLTTSTTTASKSSTNISNQAGYFYGSLTVPYGCTVNLNFNGHSINKGLTASSGYEYCGYAIIVRGALNITGTSASKLTGVNNLGSGAIDCNEWGYLSVKNIQITGNVVRDSGGAIAVHSTNSRLDISNCTITNNKCDLGNGGGVYSCGNTTITSCTISNNTAFGNGGGVYLNSSQDSTITGTSSAPTKITGNKTTNNTNNTVVGGGGLGINAARVTLGYVNIDGNTTAAYGGGVGLLGSGSLTINTGCNITNNTAPNYGGGGICSNRNVTMNAGTISGNSAKTWGGGIFVASYTFTFKAGTIGGTANKTTASSSYGGGAYVRGGATLTMTGGTVSKNTSPSHGAGIFSDGTVNLYGGTITGNSTKNGGGFYNKGTLNLRGGTINANTATTNGGGIYFEKGAVNIQATQNKITVYDNKVGSAQNNIFLPNAVYLTVNGSLATKTGSKMGITTQTAPGADNYTTKGIKVINAYNGSSFGNCASYFVSDKGSGFAVYCDQPSSTTATTGYHVFTYTKLTKTAWATSLTTSATYNALTYTRAAQTATLNSTVNTTGVAVAFSGATGAALNSAKNGITATNAGTYTIKFTPNSHYCWASESDRAAVTLTYTINQKGVTIDWSNKTPTFTGSALKPTAAIHSGGVVSGDTVTVSVSTHTSASATAANAIVPATYVAKATLGGANAANYKISTGASISDFVIGKKALSVTWGNTSLVYDGAANLPTATASGVSTTYPATLTVAKTAGDNINVGTYTAKATLSTASAAWYTLSNDTNNACKVTARDISVASNGVTVAAIAAHTYTGSAQTPAPVVKYSTKTLVSGTDYTVAYANNTNVAAANATNAPQVTVTGKGNYTGSIVTKFAIDKAKLTLTAPTSAPASTDKIYVGQLLSDVSIVGGSAVNKTTTSVTVPGTFSWVAPTTKILKTTTAAQVQFTPTDTANYDYSDAKINVAIAPTQLKVNVSEVTKNTSGSGFTVGTAVGYDIDYNGTFTFATDITQELTEPAGYSVHYYSGINSNNEPETEYMQDGVAAASITDITENTTVYVGYVAENVNYTIYYVKQNTNLSAATPAQVTNSGANLADLLTEKVVKQAPADSRVSATGEDIKKYNGFTQVAQISTDCESDYTNKLVNGDGSTYLIIYYQRNQLTVSWVANGGTLDTYSTKVYFECAPDVTPLGTPTRTGYGFQYWCTDAALENKADMTAGITENTTFYAKWGAITYNLELRPGNFEIGYNIDEEELGEGETIAHNPMQYTIDQLPLTLKNPTAVGYVFAGWVDEDGNKISKITFSTAKDYVLTATWTPAKYNVRFDANGGTVRRGSMSVTNFDKYANLDKLNPTRDGYNFVGWFTEAEGGTLTTNGDPIRLRGAITLYAHWTAESYRIDFDVNDYLDNLGFPKVDSLKITKDGEEFDWENTSEVGTLNKGDKIVVEIVPVLGYEVDEVTIGGVRIVNGGSYTVKSRYTDNLIPVTTALSATEYRIMYNLDGGSFVDSSKFPRTYTLESGTAGDGVVDIPSAEEDVTKTGYDFVNWTVGEAGSEAEATNQIDFNVISTLEAGETTIQLFANYKAAYVDLTLNNNFIRASENIQNVAYKTRALTGSTISIDAYNSTYDDGDRVFHNESYEFLGWSLTPSGGIVYPVTYDADNQPITAMDYVMQPSGNELFARWRVANVQYLIITAENNNTEYSTASSFTGVTLKAVPRYTYVSDNSVTLTYQWYKLTKDFDFEHAIDEDGNYIIFDEQADGSLVNGVVEVGAPKTFTADKQEDITLNIKQVSESGIYVCVLKVEGESTVIGGSTTISSSEGAGQFEAVIKKAVYRNASLRNITATYDGTSHNGIDAEGKRLVFSDSVTINLTDYTFTLADGTKFKVTYTYKNEGGREITQDQLVNAGRYTLEAAFSFVEDKGNYELPETLIADIVVNKVTINNLTFEMQHWNGTEWVRVENENNVALFTAPYTGNNYRIVANSNNIIESDRAEKAVIGLSDFTASAVGEYEALLSGVISGTNSANYQLGSTVASMTRTYEITKAAHKVVWEFNDKNTDVYDGTAKTIALSFKDGATALPDGVSVEYNVVFTPFNAAFTAPANSIVATAAGAGGINAGTYVITATFTDDNIANFAPIDPVTATLTVKQADYKFSDLELRKAEGLNGFGLTGDYSVNYNVDTTVKYKPELALDPANFSVTYTYTKLNAITNQYTEIVIGDGFREKGHYQISAEVTYASDLYKNNYTDVSENTNYDFNIDFIITPGREHALYVTYTGDTTTYKYGDTFDFENKIVVEIEYELDNLDGTKYYQKEVVDFGDYDVFGEDTTVPFEKFDRATLNGGDKYVITVKYLTVSATFEVDVEQAEFDISALGFVASEFTNNAYHLTYDANAHRPTVANALNGYGIKGIFDDDVVDADFEPVYEYALASDPTNFKPIDGNGLVAAGEYVIRITFTHSNLNFKALEASDVYALLTCNARIAPKSVTSVTWQYEASSGVWEDIPESGLEYKGSAYNIRAAFAGAGSDGTITGATVTVSGMGTALENAGAYTLTATMSGNYSVNVTEAFTLKGKAVTANWVVVVDGQEVPLADYQFVYNGTDQIEEIKVYYKDINNSVQSLTIKDKTTVNFKDVKDYVISALAAADTNYDVQDIENVSVSMARKEITAVTGWQYKDAEGNWVDTDGSLEYKGSAYELRAVFAGVGDDGEMNAAAKEVGGGAITDVKDEGYEVVVGESGNYNVTVSSNVVVTKKAVNVVWNYDEENAPVIFNGGNQTVTATATGVGTEANVSIIDLSDNTQSAANTADNAEYVATASLKAEYVNNYVLADSSLNWKILPKTLTFTWESKALTYNGSAQQIKATASGMCGIDVVTLTYTITGDEVNANGEAVNAGDYTITVTGIDNTNYTPDTEGSQTESFTIDKATPVLTDVVYKEYDADDTAYEKLYLRNDKISFVSKVGETDVAGSVVFAGAEGENGVATGEVSNGSNFAWEFIPADEKNYERVTGSLTIEILADSMDRLEFNTDTGRFLKRQLVGSNFDYRGLGAYIRYKSYYTENTDMSGTSTLVEYGKSTVIGQATFQDQLRFIINYTDDEGNSFAEDALGTILRLTSVEASEVQTINVEHKTLADADGNFLVGDFSIEVYTTDFTVKVKDSSNCKLTYFAGEMFNPVGLVLEITYDNSGTTREVTVREDTSGISRGSALTMGNTAAVITYNGKEIRIEGITVRPTETLELDYRNLSVLLKDVGSFGLPEITLKDGSPLPEGITYRNTIMLGEQEVQTIAAAGEYTVTVSFDVQNPKYNAIPDITYTVSVIDKFAYTVVTNKPDDTQFVYNGNSINYQLKSYQITDVDGNVVNDVTVTYEIMRDGMKVDEVKGAGSYTITVKFGNISADYAPIPNENYVITVDKAENSITTFTLDGWVAGDTPNAPVVVAAGGTADAQFTYSATEDGTFTADVPLTAGTYFVKVYIPGTADFNAAIATIQFVIKKPAAATSDGGVEISPEGGLNPDATITAGNVENVNQYETEDKKPIKGVDVTVSGDTLDENESVTIRIKVDEQDKDKKLKVYKVEGNTLVDMEATREGDDMVFTTTDVNGSRYILMETPDGEEPTPPNPDNPNPDNPNPDNPNPDNPNPDKPGDNTGDNGDAGLIAGLSIGAVVVVILVIIVIVVFVKKKRG